MVGEPGEGRSQPSAIVPLVGAEIVEVDEELEGPLAVGDKAIQSDYQDWWEPVIHEQA